MHILVTNDDGIQAPGLHALARQLRELGRVSVVAPNRNWSASGHVKTMHRPLRAYQTELPDGSEAWSTDGAPSDCVALALLGLIKEPVDLLVSGINPTANVGHDVTYSGTVTAAMEGAIAKVPSMAISLDTPDGRQGPLDYEGAAAIGAALAAKILAKDRGTLLLNVNIPYGLDPTEATYTITRQGLRLYQDELVERTDPRGQPYYWIGGEPPTGVDEAGTDIGELARGHVSITPLQLDLTDYQAMDQLDGLTDFQD
jgi:5'-nucleotidase